MKTIELPYNKTHISLRIDERYLNAILTPKTYTPLKNERELVEEALDNPIGSERLEELIKGRNSMVIITSDHTRPVPSGITLPILLRRIRGANPDIDITIVISTGTHRATTHEEMLRKFGEEIVRNERIVIHNSRKCDDMKELGTISTGITAEVNRKILETDFLMAEGFIEPHFFAGFSGGRKSVFPGVASLSCVKSNHCAEYIDSPYARTGILKNNPVHMEALEMARLAGLKFILNVAIDKDKKIINAFAGHFDEAHIAGCEFVRELAGVKAVHADIAVTTNGGYPLDQNIYQAVKSMTAAEAVCNPGGVIIVAAACSDGHGGESFYSTFKSASSPSEVTASILKRSRLETVEDQWESQILARILEKHRVIMVADSSVKEIVEDMHMDFCNDIDSALTLARRYKGSEADVTVIPDGIAVIVE